MNQPKKHNVSVCVFVCECVCVFVEKVKKSRNLLGYIAYSMEGEVGIMLSFGFKNYLPSYGPK